MCVAVCRVCVAAPSDSQFLAQVKDNTKWLTSYGTRQVGTAAHRRLQDDLLAKMQKLAKLPNVKVWTDEFPVMVPVNDQTSLQIKDGAMSGRHVIYPIWPDVARLNATPAAGISGKLIYVGDAAYDQLPAHSLRGNIAVMEMSAYAHYRRAFNFGAAAVIFVGSNKAGEPMGSEQSLYKPRYYVPPGPLADALRSGQIKSAKIVSREHWQAITARNIYVAIKPAGSQGVAPYAVVAPYDSMSRVMGVAPGADSALDCATVMSVLENVASDPPRPLLFGFLDAYHINQVGMRRMAAMLTVTPGPHDWIRQKYHQIEQDTLRKYQVTAAELAPFKTVKQGLTALRDRSKCDFIRPIFKNLVGRDVLKLRDLQGDLRLAALRVDKEKSSAAVRQQMLLAIKNSTNWLLKHYASEFTAEQRDALKSGQAFADKQIQAVEHGDSSAKNWNGFDQARQIAKTLRPICKQPLDRRNGVLNALFGGAGKIPAKDIPVAESAWKAMVQDVEGQLDQQKKRVAYFAPLDKLRKGIAGYFGLDQSGQDEPACKFVVGIDLSDCGVMVGPGMFDNYHRVETTDRDLLRAMKHAIKEGRIWPKNSPSRRIVDLDSITGRKGKDGGYLGDRALITGAALSFRLPGITWLTDDAPRQRVDSPTDRYDAMDWSRVAPQLPATRDFLHWLFTTKDYTPRLNPTMKWRNGMGRIVDIAAGESVASVPRRGFLVTLTSPHYPGEQDGIRCNDFAKTGYDGSFRIPLMCADVYPYLENFTLAAFKINDETGAITESASASSQSASGHLATSFSLRNSPGEQLPRVVAFPCTELNGPSFFDARFLEPLTQGELLDAVRGGQPKQAEFSIDPAGQMWGLVEPGMRWQLIVRSGSTGVRMALLNAAQNARKRGLTLDQAFRRGYSVNQRLPSIPTYLSAKDFYSLDQWRLAVFRGAGIRSDKIDQIREHTKKSLEKAAAAIKDDNGAALERSAVRALSSEIRAYRATKSTGQDVVRGAIFLMLMILPFSVAMERLLFACARIGAQIVASLAIFALMTLLLWSFHPAFRISSQPLVIVMAFMILALSLVVITMILGRFRGAMREFQSTLAEGSGAQMGRGGLLGSAVFLGIANMRKRKMRTALTAITIVLVTFALLCFSSTSSYVDKKEFRLDGVKAKHPSVLVRRPSFGPIDWQAKDSLKNLIAKTGAAVGARAWLVAGLADTTWRLYMQNPKTGAQVGMHGALGLPPNENRMTGVDAVLSHWQSFAKNGGCYLPKDMAAQLGVKVGDTLVIRGRDVVLRGVFDPIALEDKITLLDGQRILPYDYSSEQQDWVNHDSQGAIEQETESATAMEPPSSGQDRFLPAREVVILPTELVRDMDGDLRSLGISCKTAKQASQVAHLLADTSVYPAYFANKTGGVSVVVATPLISVPPKNLLIPLAIAALIIFTTMLNSVSERKKEIYVYSSLGLAPFHIGAMFIAEALTYGLMGAVFGYVAGQATATLLTHVGWMGGVTLNYSGTAAIQTMILVQAVVVLAALVPAIMAGRIASPSSEMDWQVPEPVDGEIHDILPFTVSPGAAAGLMAFIHQYLEAHRDGVLGRFDVDAVRLLPPGTDGCIAGLEARIWLAPYDMGVRQLMRLTVQPPEDDVCAIAVRIRHETGTHKVWWRLNKPFFYELRRQLLGWRKVTPERIQEYIDRMRDVTETESEMVWS